MAWDTVANVVSGAARGLGLVSAAIADPYASPDPNILQMTQLLTDLGQDLVRDYAWSHLQTEKTFNTVAATASYALPTDFARIVDGTAWNRTKIMPLLGPVGSQQWQALKGGLISLTVPGVFRIYQNLFWIYSTPTAIEAIYYEYVSSYWVDTGGGTTSDADNPTTSADSLLFDRRLLVEGLKMYFQRAKGFGFDPAAFDALVAKARGADGAAPVLSLNGSSGVKLIDGSNVADTGYGS